MTGPQDLDAHGIGSSSAPVQPPRERLEFLGCRLAVRRGDGAPSHYVLLIHLFDLFRKSSFSPQRPGSPTARDQGKQSPGKRFAGIVLTILLANDAEYAQGHNHEDP
jgi:hypothetical protein